MKFRGWRFFIGCGCLKFRPAGVLVPLLETGSYISRHSHVDINIVIVCAREWCRVIVDDPAPNHSHLNIPFPITYIQSVSTSVRKEYRAHFQRYP